MKGPRGEYFVFIEPAAGPAFFWGLKMFSKKTKEKMDFDRNLFQPAVQTGICTGEMTFGFLDKRTGRFTGSRLVKDNAELEEILRSYGLGPDDIRHIY